MTVIENLKDLDTALFLFLNGMHNSFFDFLMYWFSNRFIWIPLYLFFLYLFFRKYPKNVWWILLFVAIAVTFTDQISVFLKNYFERPRPCHDVQIAHLVHTVNGVCGGPYGFVSSHAANSFAVAFFLIPFFNRYFRFFPALIILWAAAVSSSRVYLGVHYPGDILVGGVVGALSGYLFARLFFCIFARSKKTG